MSLLAITNAGVAYKDQVFAGQEVQNITRVIFRNINGLLPGDVIDLDQAMPTTDIVHSQAIELVSALDGDTVVMSTVLGYDIGDFEYNWYGVIAKKADLSDVLIAVVQTHPQTKIKTNGPVTGNYSAKSIAWKTVNIAQSLNVTLSALPWQVADNTFVTQAAYDLAMADKSPTNHNHDTDYLGKTAKANDSSKLEGKTKAQVITEAQSGMAIGDHSHDLSYLDKGHWPTIANHTDAEHDIIFKAGKIIDSNAQLGINLASDMVKRLDGAWAAGNGNGGLFSGSIAANETYHCYAITKTETETVLVPTFTNLGAQFSTRPGSVACSADGLTVYVADSNSDLLYRSTNSGTSFTDLGAQFGSEPDGIACSADGQIVYVLDGSNDSLYRSTNSGTSFTDLGAQFGTLPVGVACSADGQIVYVLEYRNDSLYRSTNSGTSFTDLGAQFSTTPLAVACSADGLTVYVVDGSSNSLYRSTNSGTSFTDLGAQFSIDSRGVACSDDGAVVYVVDTGSDSIYRSTDSGTSFSDLGAQFSTDPRRVACSADGLTVYVVDVSSDSLYRARDSVNIMITTVDAGFSTSETATDMPASYTAYRRIGSVLTDDSENIRGFLQHGDNFMLNVPDTPGSISGNIGAVVYLRGTMPTGISRGLTSIMLVSTQASASAETANQSSYVKLSHKDVVDKIGSLNDCDVRAFATSGDVDIDNSVIYTPAGSDGKVHINANLIFSTWQKGWIDARLC